MKRISYILPLLFIIMFACGTGTGKQEQTENKEERVKALRRNIKNTIDIELYDQYARVFRKGKATMVAGNTFVAPLNLVQGSFSVKTKFLGREIEPMSGGYYSYDFKTNLVMMHVSGQAQKYAPLATSFQSTGYYSLKLDSGKIKQHKITVRGMLTIDSVDYKTTMQKMEPGVSVFNSSHNLAGVFSRVKTKTGDTLVIVPVEKLASMLPAKGSKRNGISALRLKSNKKYTAPAKVKAFKVETSMGNFAFKVYADLPGYKKNMIKLVEDQFYDSLLIHRVIYKFLLQTGAADTKYAKPGDPVGWKGPGYMLPTVVKPKYIHKRGAIAMSKPPSFKNPDNKTSGSQFYIIAGRTFSDDELDDYEERGDFKYTASQRNLYKTAGGAAYLDGEYAVIGEITSGMDVVDRISSLPVDDEERPLKDVRIKRIKVVR